MEILAPETLRTEAANSNCADADCTANNQNKPHVPVPSTSDTTGANEYVYQAYTPENDEDVILNRRSPTPPLQARTQQAATTAKKGIGKSTIKRPSDTSTPTPAKKKSPAKAKQNPSAHNSKKQTQVAEDTSTNSYEKERLNVLKELSANRNKDDDVEDEFDHWGISLGKKIKRVPYARLQEKVVAHVNAVFSDAVLGEAHPALGNFSSQSTFQVNQQVPAMAYTLPIQSQTQAQYYLSAPNTYQASHSQAAGFASGLPTGQTTRTATSSGLNVQPDVTATPSTPIQQQQQPFNPFILQNQQVPQSQVQYGQLNTNDLTGYLSQSPLKVMPPIRCHTINNFGPTPSAQATLEFANL